VFNLNQNRCSDWIRMGVQVEQEYALLKCNPHLYNAKYLVLNGKVISCTFLI